MDATQITSRKKILFVCAKKKRRSFTAEKMFSGSLLYDVKSRGVAKDARIRLTESDISWADLVFVMEKNHKNRIARDFESTLAGKKIVCLFIEDIYDPMEPALIRELRLKLAPYLLVPEGKEPTKSSRHLRGAAAQSPKSDVGTK